MKRNTILLFALFIGALISICTAIYFIDQRGFVYDESGFVQHGYLFFKTFFLKGDFFGQIWLDRMSCYGSSNPKAGMMLLGAIKYFCVDLGCGFDMGGIGDDVISMRFVNAVFSVGAVVFMFLITAPFLKGAYKYIGAFLLIVNPVFWVVSVSLVPEAPMLFFVMAALVVLFKVRENIDELSYIMLLLLSILIGLAVSSRLYGFCVYLTFLMVCFNSASKDISRSFIFKIIFVSFLSGFVFFITNPSFYRNIFFGFTEMTTIHKGILRENKAPLTIYEVKYLLTYPYLLFSFNSFNIGSLAINPLSKSDFIWIMLGYSLVYKGFRRCISSKIYLPVFWFLASHLWLLYAFLNIGGIILSVKTLVLPMTAVVCLASLAFSKKNNT